MSDRTPEHGEQQPQGAPDRPARPVPQERAAPQSPSAQREPTTTPAPGPAPAEPPAEPVQWAGPFRNAPQSQPGQPQYPAQPRYPVQPPLAPQQYPAQPFPQSGVPGYVPGYAPGPPPGPASRHTSSGRVVPPVPQAPQGGFAAGSYPGAPTAAPQPQQFAGPPVFPGQYPQQQFPPPQPYYSAQPYGRPTYPGMPPAEPKGMSITALVLGILGFVSGGWLILPQILAVVFGHLGLKKEPSVKGMAIAGLIMGYLMVAISLAYGAFLIFIVNSSSWD